MDQLSQTCLKVIQNFGILKVQFSGVVEDFKLKCCRVYTYMDDKMRNSKFGDLDQDAVLHVS
jgi:hypothetical protein